MPLGARHVAQEVKTETQSQMTHCDVMKVLTLISVAFTEKHDDSTIQLHKKQCTFFQRKLQRVTEY